jgi:HD superfamily phosphohydrolase
MPEPESPVERFEQEIEKFVDEYFSSYPVPFTEQPGKVIHDALWGTQFVQSHELAIIDTPLIQRLRRIKQTAFAYLIFPSATHSRLEHSLGVLFQSDKLLNALDQNPRYRLLVKGNENLIRAAAVLHDCGHGPFSHSSEEIYQFLPDMQALIGPGGIHEECHPHEVLAHYIVKSEPFKKRFTQIIDNYGVAIDNNKVADMILGNWSDPTTKYLCDIINGPFDADKLDYLFRDGHFSGLPLKIDLDRLWHCVQIHTVPEKDIRMLIMSINGITSLEQIVFSKMVLFSSLYQHHKVRACDCMMKAILEYCMESEQSICGYELKKSTDFLWLTDDRLYSEADRLSKNNTLHQLIHNLKFRRLFKRALIISRATVEKPYGDFFGYTVLKKFCTDLKDNDHELRSLAREICQEAENPCGPLEVWIDLPKLPPIGSADDTYVNIGGEKDPEFLKLKDIFRVDDWAQSYAEHNWRAHVFCPDNDEVRQKISVAAQKILEEKFSVKFNNSARKLCKI